MSSWNPRYLRYCELHGLEPDAMLTLDQERWPGGQMVGFILYIGDAWQAFWELKGRPGRHPMGMNKSRHDWIKGPDDYAAFDGWLPSFTPDLNAYAGRHAQP